MRSGLGTLGALLFLAAAPAAGQQLATSPRPDAVEVTVYRAPNREPGEKLELRWLNGFALISETRRIDFPAGESNLRFGGVAGGIVPESAIVTGLPAGVIEKNQDAFLLSPASLLDASLGRRVHIRRTSRATGAVTEAEAVVRTGAGGAVVLETPAGIETLRCSGLPETLVYDRIPEGVVAAPTLSVRVRSPAPAAATVKLSYLATGFDWQADYVAELSRDGSRMDLFAWLTLANGDETGFRDADANAVAGRLNREGVVRQGREPQAISLQCWPQGTTTSDLKNAVPFPPAAPPPPPVGLEDIVVTGSRIPRPNLTAASPVTVVQAEQEELGDLKLYRIPEPVTVAARSQKQVALLQRTGVPVDIVYRQSVHGEGSGGAAPTVVTRNRESEKLGLPLPSGQIAFFQRLGDRRVMIGRGAMRDRAVGEEIEIALGESTDVRTEVVREAHGGGGGGHYRLTVTNAKDRPVRFEAEFRMEGARIDGGGRRIETRDGRPLWRVVVPANGSAVLRYRTSGSDRG